MTQWDVIIDITRHHACLTQTSGWSTLANALQDTMSRTSEAGQIDKRQLVERPIIGDGAEGIQWVFNCAPHFTPDTEYATTKPSFRRPWNSCVRILEYTSSGGSESGSPVQTRSYFELLCLEVTRSFTTCVIGRAIWEKWRALTKVGLQMTHAHCRFKIPCSGWMNCCKVQVPNLAGRLKWFPTFQPKLVVIEPKPISATTFNLDYGPSDSWDYHVHFEWYYFPHFGIFYVLL